MNWMKASSLPCASGLQYSDNTPDHTSFWDHNAHGCTVGYICYTCNNMGAGCENENCWNYICTTLFFRHKITIRCLLLQWMCSVGLELFYHNCVCCLLDREWLLNELWCHAHLLEPASLLYCSLMLHVLWVYNGRICFIWWTVKTIKVQDWLLMHYFM